MDPATLTILYTALYTALGTLGLVATDAYVNANTLFLDTTVAETVEHEGYDPSVVDGIFVAEVKKITSTPSLVVAPQIQSSKAKPVSAALAEAAGLEAALTAMHSLMGVIPPKLVASVIAEDIPQQTRVSKYDAAGNVAEQSVGEHADLKMVLTGYERRSGYFYLSVEGRTAEEDVDDLVRAAAFEAVLKLEPYLALLYDLNQRAEKNLDLAPARTLIDANIRAQADAVTHPHRALLENLRGILSLLERNQVMARRDFMKAIASNPRQPVGYLNLAFLDVQEDRFEDALKRLEPVIGGYLPMTRDPVLRASAYIIKGAAETEMERFKDAEASFRRAVALNPQSSEAYVYWARMLRKSGRAAEVEDKLALARQNALYFENFPEMALLYFWLTEEGQQPLERRLSVVEAL